MTTGLRLPAKSLRPAPTCHLLHDPLAHGPKHLARLPQTRERGARCPPQHPQTPAQLRSGALTGKIRMGWDRNKNYKLIARIIEEEGGSLVAVHGRTKEQRYSGDANWDAIAEVKSLVKIPVIGSGDVKTVADIQRMKQHTNCDAVMIGRAAIANPWIFAGLDREQVSAEMLQQTVREHLQKSVQFYGEEDGQRLFRKYAVQYLLLKTLDRESRKEILKERPSGEFLEMLDQVYAVTAQ